MHSLRLRLLLVTALVAGGAVATMALFSRYVVNTEFHRYTRVAEAPAAEPAARALSDDARSRGSLAGADSVLARLAPATGHVLALVEPSGVLIASTRSLLVGSRVTFGPDRSVTLEGSGRDARSGIGLQLMGPPSAPVLGADGRTLGTLLVLPPLEARDEGAAPFLRAVNRRLWFGVAGAIGLGLVLVWLLSARIVGPIEALTRAAEQAGDGDLSVRVEPRGADEIATLARRFNAMTETLERTRDARRRLTRDVAHELRTPLTTLRGQIEAIQDGLLDADPATIRSLHEETLLLSRLVDDLGVLAEAEEGGLHLEFRPYDARATLESAAGAFRSRAGERGVEVRVVAGEAVHVVGDPDRLAQVLRNLVANAVTHTPAGGVVTLSVDGTGSGAAFEVADTGVGIGAEHLPHVFERFYRADPSRSRATGGAGLGLAIVRRLVEHMGGTVRIESAPGSGTRVCFTIAGLRAEGSARLDAS